VRINLIVFIGHGVFFGDDARMTRMHLLDGERMLGGIISRLMGSDRQIARELSDDSGNNPQTAQVGQPMEHVITKGASKKPSAAFSRIEPRSRSPRHRAGALAGRPLRRRADRYDVANILINM
jgi:hypothetical protein